MAFSRLLFGQLQGLINVPLQMHALITVSNVLMCTVGLHFLFDFVLLALLILFCNVHEQNLHSVAIHHERDRYGLMSGYGIPISVL